MGIRSINVSKENLLTRMVRPNGYVGLTSRGIHFLLVYSDRFYAKCKEWSKEHGTNVTREAAKVGTNSSYFSNAKTKYIQVTGDSVNVEGYGLYSAEVYATLCKAFHVEQDEFLYKAQTAKADNKPEKKVLSMPPKDALIKDLTAGQLYTLIFTAVANGIDSSESGERIERSAASVANVDDQLTVLLKELSGPPKPNYIAPVSSKLHNVAKGAQKK